MNAVTVSHLYKSYRPDKKTIVQALHNISFEVQQKELFGIIGPDGAGKTTLFRMLTTLLLADEGSAVVAGHDVVNEYKKIRLKVGYMPGRFSLYQDLTVEENLNFFATLFDTSIDENYDLIKGIYIQIEKFKTRKAGALSGGMKQKLALSCALIHRPEVLFLDEPTTGVDAVSRKEFWGLLKQLQEQNITILVSTPYMDEAILCDRVALLQQGRILDIDTPQGIINNFRSDLYEVKHAQMYPLLQLLKGADSVHSCYPFGQVHHVVFNESKSPETIKPLLEQNGFGDVEFKEIKPNIEDCFMSLMDARQIEQ